MQPPKTLWLLTSTHCITFCVARLGYTKNPRYGVSGFSGLFASTSVGATNPSPRQWIRHNHTMAAYVNTTHHFLCGTVGLHQKSPIRGRRSDDLTIRRSDDPGRPWAGPGQTLGRSRTDVQKPSRPCSNKAKREQDARHTQHARCKQARPTPTNARHHGAAQNHDFENKSLGFT